MSRAVFLSAGGDPFIAAFAIKLFKERWYDEVDSFYICYNNSCEIPKEVQAEFIGNYLDDPKIKIIYWPTQIGYGQPITKCFSVCEEDLILLIEDDGFIFTPGVVDAAFKRIESGEVDALGSPRFSCGLEISEALKVKYDLNYSGYGDRGPNFWPNFFFCKREDLLKTDLDFAPHGFEAGIYYPELDHTMTNTEAGDTFVWTCIQMRNNGVSFADIPQFHSSPYEIAEKETKMGNWIGEDPYWIHGGSLSTSWGHHLKDKTPDTSEESTKLEFESRVAWWDIVSVDTIKPEGFKDFSRQYRDALYKFKERANLDSERIEKKIAIYRGLLNV